MPGAARGGARRELDGEGPADVVAVAAAADDLKVLAGGRDEEDLEVAGVGVVDLQRHLRPTHLGVARDLEPAEHVPGGGVGLTLADPDQLRRRGEDDRRARGDAQPGHADEGGGVAVARLDPQDGGREREVGLGPGRAGVGDDVATAAVLERGGEGVLDGAHRAGQHGEDLQVRRVGPHPLEQGRVSGLPGADAGELAVLGPRLVGVHELALVPAVAGADLEAGRGGAVGEVDPQRGLLGLDPVVGEGPADSIARDPLVDRDGDLVRDLGHRLAAGVGEAVRACGRGEAGEERGEEQGLVPHLGRDAWERVEVPGEGTSRARGLPRARGRAGDRACLLRSS